MKMNKLAQCLVFLLYTWCGPLWSQVLGDRLYDDGFEALNLPPDPATIAPPLPVGQGYDFGQSTAFLYSGPEPIQVGVEPGTIDPARAAVVRGTVRDGAGAPVRGARVVVKDHAKYGHTVTRLDGMFDLAVNGGGPVTLHISKDGWFPVQPRVDVPWQQFAVAADAVMIQPNTKVDQVTLTSAAPMQAATGTVVSDARGSRQAQALFPAGTQAEMVMDNGSRQALTSLSVRATEYTVGDAGPSAMPGELPGYSAYTYAVEFSVDEAMAAGADTVEFSNPVPTYVDNFMELPAGAVVPAGYYDAEKSQWVPSDDGRVIAVIAESGGMAQLDLGSGSAADQSELDALGIDADELTHLAGRFNPGDSFWRVPVRHFSTFDYNFPTYADDPGVEVPDDNVRRLDGRAAPNRRNRVKDERPRPDERLCATAFKSVVECPTRVLSETIPLAGTNSALTYSSERMPGAATPTLEFTLTRPQIAPDLREVGLFVRIAGQIHTFRFDPAPDLSVRFTWDGRDAYGRPVVGSFPLDATIFHNYARLYCFVLADDQPSPVGTFGAPCAGDQVVDSRVIDRRARRFYSAVLHAPGPDAPSQVRDVGGWTISEHHFYDTVADVLYLGDGARIASPGIIGALVTTHAGGGTSLEDDVPATEAQFDFALEGVAVAPDGTIYVSLSDQHVVRAISPDGIIQTVAGTMNVSGYGGDGGPGELALLDTPEQLAILPDGSLFIADRQNHRIRRLGPDGIIETFAGGGSNPDFINQYRLEAMWDRGPRWLAADADGSLFFGGGIGFGTFTVDPSGVIRRITSRTGQIAIASDGLVYVDHERTLTYNPFDNTGRFHFLYPLDADDEEFDETGFVTGFVLDPDGTAYFGNGNCIWKIDQYADRVPTEADRAFFNSDLFVGIRDYDIVLGRSPLRDDHCQSESTTYRDGVAAGANLGGGIVLQMALMPDGSLLAPNLDRLLRISPKPPGFEQDEFIIASPNRSELYRFDISGRHLETLDKQTGSVRHTFSYDAQGRLVSATDPNGNEIRVERDGAGLPSALVAPFGQRTQLATDAEGYLNRVTSPESETWQLTYTELGLLTSATTPRGDRSEYQYDQLGKVTRVTDRAGEVWNYVADDGPSGSSVVVETPEGRDPTYDFHVEGDDRQFALRQQTGELSSSVTAADGSVHVTRPDGTHLVSRNNTHPRWGVQEPVLATTVTTPANHTVQLDESVTSELANPLDPLSLVAETTTWTLGNGTFEQHFDAATRRYVTTSPAGRTEVTEIDEQGRITLVQRAGLAPVTLTYDARGRLSQFDQGDGDRRRTTRLSYGADGFLESISDPLDQSETFATDENGRITRVTYDDGRFVDLTYNGMGSLETVRPPDRAPYQLSYSPLEKFSGMSFPDVGQGAQADVVNFDGDGEVANMTTRGGRTATLARDGAGRVTGLTVPRGAFSYSYDASNLIANATSPDGVRLDFSYDGVLPTAETYSGPLQGTVSLTYNDRLLPASVTVDGGVAVPLSYDDDGLSVQAGDMSTSRDAVSGLVSARGLGLFSESLGYNEFGELTSVTTEYGGVPLYSLQLTRDNLGRVENRQVAFQSEANSSWDYTYDAGKRLRRVNRNGNLFQEFAYDANDNRLTTASSGGTESATYDGRDQILTLGAATFAHNRDGQRVTSQVGSAVTTYSYGVAGELLSVAQADGTTIDYLLDASHRRVGKLVNDAFSVGYLYLDQLNPVATVEAGGNVLSQFVYGSRLNVPDYMIRNGTRYAFVVDDLGSVQLVVNVETGQVSQRIEYGPFGEVITDTNPGFQPFGYAGGLYDPSTKLVHFGARDYDPATGRWLTPDPRYFDGGSFNLYAYVLNDPINRFDPTGNAGPLAVVAVVAEIGFVVLDVAALVGSIRDYCLGGATTVKDIIEQAFLLGAGVALPLGGFAALKNLTRSGRLIDVSDKVQDSARAAKSLSERRLDARFRREIGSGMDAIDALR